MSNDQDSQYARMSAAIAFLAERWETPPSLAEAAEAAHMSPAHFQRAFTRWVGISPKRFTGHLQLNHAKAALQSDAPVLEAALAAGLSGPSRLHDLAVAFEGLSPGEIKSRGGGQEIRYGTAETPFGPIFTAASGRGVTRLAFIGADDGAAAFDAERLAWPEAGFTEDEDLARRIAKQLFSPEPGAAGPLRLAPRGTNFQIKVWQALLAIPPGATATYAMIARAIGAPGAARAVGGACGANPIALLIPCHRVLREGGALGGYAFGLARKRALVAWESARREEAGFRPSGHAA